MRLSLIHNPTAGEGNPTPAELRERLAAAGFTIRYASTKEPGWEVLVAEPTDLVVAAGGDGTVGKVVPGLAGTGTPLLIVPLGTANNIALTLGLPTEWREAVDSAASPARRPFDCGLASGPWGALPFIESAGAGFFPRLLAAADSGPVEAALELMPIMQRFDRLRDLIPRMLETLETRSYSIEADGRDLSGDYLLVEAMNVRSIGPRLQLAPAADPGDGMLDLVLIGAADAERFGRDLEAWFDHRPGGPAWGVTRARRIVIEGDRVAWHLDDALQPEPEPGGLPRRVSAMVTIEAAGAVELVVPVT